MGVSVSFCVYPEYVCVCHGMCVSLWDVGHKCVSLWHKGDSVSRGKNTFRGSLPMGRVFSYYLFILNYLSRPSVTDSKKERVLLESGNDVI